MCVAGMPYCVFGHAGNIFLSYFLSVWIFVVIFTADNVP